MAELPGIRVLEARAAAHRRCLTSPDLIQACSQVVRSGGKDVFIVILYEIAQILPHNGGISVLRCEDL